MAASEYKPYTEDLRTFSDNSELKNVKSIEIWTDDSHGGQDRLHRSEILDFNNEGFLLKGVLSEPECNHYIEQGEKLQFEDIPEVKKSYRNCERIILSSPKLSEIIWKRISPQLENITIEGDPHDVHIHGVTPLLQGTWEPLGINELFRFCKYHPGGHFAPHFDGHYTRTDDVRSMKTFMLYLNGDFEGGTTNFVNEDQTLFMNEEGRYCAEDRNIIYRVHPEAGMAIIFNHHRLHEGHALGSGVKYILRSDILYRRIGGPSVDPKENEALQIVQEAERLEAKGENMAAMQLYRKAFRMSPSLAASYGCPA